MPLHVIYEAVVETASTPADIRRDIATAVEAHGMTVELVWQYNETQEGGK